MHGPSGTGAGLKFIVPAGGVDVAPQAAVVFWTVPGSLSIFDWASDL